MKGGSHMRLSLIHISFRTKGERFLNKENLILKCYCKTALKNEFLRRNRGKSPHFLEIKYLYIVFSFFAKHLDLSFL